MQEDGNKIHFDEGEQRAGSLPPHILVDEISITVGRLLSDADGLDSKSDELSMRPTFADRATGRALRVDAARRRSLAVRLGNFGGDQLTKEAAEFLKPDAV